jgi:hypothetical protein
MRREGPADLGQNLRVAVEGRHILRSRRHFGAVVLDVLRYAHVNLLVQGSRFKVGEREDFNLEH